MHRARQSRARHDARHSVADHAIPDKLYFRIGEVSRLAETKPYVLRYWESEFPSLKPVKSRTGHRLYRRKDVEMVFRIKRLLYNEGFTIEGARRHLAGNSEAITEKPSNGGATDGAALNTVRRELQAILTMLSRKC